MLPFPLQLKGSVLGELVCKPSEGVEFAQTIELTANPTFGRSDDDPTQWQVTLKVVFKAGAGEKLPLQYTGHVEVIGVFAVSADLEEDKALKIVAMNCPSLLYGTARETVAFLTARGPHGILHLPTVTFAGQTIAPVASIAEPIGEGQPKRPAKTKAT